MAAGLALLARDRNFQPPISKQILIYPMIDDRTTTPRPGPDMSKFIIWNYNDNITSWSALCGKDTVGTDSVSPYAAASRATDLSNLPNTYIDMGQLDIFCLENVTYATRLMQVGVDVELHVYPGCPHGFDMFAPRTAVAQRARENRVKAMRTI